MAEPIVFTSRFKLLGGNGASFEAMFSNAVELMSSSKPRTALYAAYRDEAGTEVRIVHAFPDAAAIAAHFEGSEERSKAAYELIVPAGFEIFGRAPASIVSQMRREAAEAGVSLDLAPDPIGGFLRAPA